MSNNAVASRYAVALFQLAKEKDLLAQIGNGLQIVEDVFKLTPSLSNILLHPKIKNQSKKELLQKSFSNDVNEYVLNTLYLLIDKGRISDLKTIINKYKTLAYEEQGIAEAKVYSTKALSEEDKKAISETFAKKVNKQQLVITNIVDPNMLGGLRIKIGDRIFDGSIKGQLDRLERQLVRKR